MTTDLVLDLGSGGLGVLEVLHQLCVAQEIAACRGQPRQQVVLQLLQQDLELVLLLRQVILKNEGKWFAQYCSASV